MELAMRLEQNGLKRRFDPSVDVTHQTFEWLNKGDTSDFWKALYKIAGKMGVREFVRGV